MLYTKYKAICIPEVTNTVNIPNYLYRTILYYKTKAYSHFYDVCVSMSRKCHETHIDQLYVITSRSVRTHMGPDGTRLKQLPELPELGLKGLNRMPM